MNTALSPRAFVPPTVVVLFSLLIGIPAAAQIAPTGATTNAVAGPVRGSDTAYDPVNKVYAVIGAYGAGKGVFVNEAGAPVTSVFTFATGAFFAHYPRITYSPELNGGAGGFLVTWHQGDGPGGANVLHGRLLTYAATPALGGDVVLSGTQGTWWEAAAGGAYSTTSHTFLVAYQMIGSIGVRARRVGLDGLPVGGEIQVSIGYGREPGVAWNSATDEFGISFSGEDATSITTSFARVRASDGVLLQRNLFNRTGSGSFISDLVYNPASGTFVMTWFQAAGGNRTAEFDAAGQLLRSGVVTTTVGTYDGLSLGLNRVSGTILLVGHHNSGEVGAAELDGHGVKTSAEIVVTSTGGKGSYYPRVSGNTTRGDWDVSFSAAFANLSNQIVSTAAQGGGGGAGGAPVPLVDTVVYSPTTGAWARFSPQTTGGFTQVASGGWSPSWDVARARFNQDAFSDLFLFNPTTGQWFRELSNSSGGLASDANGTWWPGWQRYVLDLNGDGISDIFLYDPVSGQWFKCLTTSTGFAYFQGGWDPGWEITPMFLNSDTNKDLFLYKPTTGRWFWALSDSTGGFTYPVTGLWSSWTRYPGDFNGDGLTDLLLHQPITGLYFVAFTGSAGFSYVFGGWSPVWTPLIVDIDGNGKSDLLLQNLASGDWQQLLGNGAGAFSKVAGGTLGLGWELHTADVNSDKRTDYLFYQPSSGLWCQALDLTAPGGGCSRAQGYLSQGLKLVVGDGLP